MVGPSECDEIDRYPDSKSRLVIYRSTYKLFQTGRHIVSPRSQDTQIKDYNNHHHHILQSEIRTKSTLKSNRQFTISITIMQGNLETIFQAPKKKILNRNYNRLYIIGHKFRTYFLLIWMSIILQQNTKSKHDLFIDYESKDMHFRIHYSKWTWFQSQSITGN